ncbi:MAG: ribonuclease P protein component [Alphaproteobacteria bacterium 16-39-46]|nr:MAG: ribonuclease P protein component [Alphaproteobacteria bacterium 16-39-46]OZA42625.1 MAG: ribonuclease P protein component [Alphaproteobacteria bacterium 17-39-52]
MDRCQFSTNTTLQSSLKAFSRHTLKRRFDFLNVAKEGRKAVMPSLIVQAILKKGDEAEVRVGFTATRKIGSAVVRNRARRRLRSTVDLIAKERSLKSGDYVLIARQITATAPFEVLMKDFRKALTYVS